MATPAIPRPAPAQPTPPQPRRAPAASPPPQAHGGNVQYQQRMIGVHVDRNENLVNHNWYRFLLWTLGIGGFAFLAWLAYGSFLAGRWTAPAPTIPAAHAVPAAVTRVLAPTPVQPLSPPAPPPQPAIQPTPVDLSPVERGLNRIADNLSRPATEPARFNSPSTPEKLDEATARWLESQ